VAIRIGDTTPAVTAIRPTSAARATGAATAANDRLFGSNAAELDISLLARQALQTLPAVRSDRIEAVRRQLASGSFTVEPEALAERILGQ
jgi:flagellar biosynthesis anti-sigma factor FlgM